MYLGIHFREICPHFYWVFSTVSCLRIFDFKERVSCIKHCKLTKKKNLKPVFCLTSSWTRTSCLLIKKMPILHLNFIFQAQIWIEKDNTFFIIIKHKYTWIELILSFLYLATGQVDIDALLTRIRCRYMSCESAQCCNVHVKCTMGSNKVHFHNY